MGDDSLIVDLRGGRTMTVVFVKRKVGQMMIEKRASRATGV